MHQGTNLRYIQLNTDLGRGFACISFEWKKTDDTLTYSAGLSFCSPRDNFRKDLARRIAVGRRETTGRHEPIASSLKLEPSESKFVSNKEFEMMMFDIIDRAGEGGIVPKWAMKAFKAKSFKFGLRESDMIGA